MLAACHASPRLAVERIVVSESAAAQRLERAGVPPERLVERAAKLLDAAPGFVPAARARADDARLLGQLTVQRADVLAAAGGEGAVATVAVTLELSGRGAGALRETGRAAEPLGDGAAALVAALDRAALAAVERAVAAFALAREAERKPVPALVRDLESDDAAVRDHAVRALADRGDRSAVPALIARLEDKDPEVSERAVGALAQLGDARAVPALIALARHRDPPYVAQLAHLVGDLGGPDARAWLLTLASGHPDEVVRGAAREALASIAARERERSAETR